MIKIQFFEIQKKYKGAQFKKESKIKSTSILKDINFGPITWTYTMIT
jgi:hypothetical protein